MTSPAYLALLDQMRDLHIRKSAGYAGQSADTWANFREAEGWGVTPFLGCMVRMGDKFIRAQNLVHNPANDQVNEPLRDTLLDLAAYALIGVCLLEDELPNGWELRLLRQEESK